MANSELATHRLFVDYDSSAWLATIKARKVAEIQYFDSEDGDWENIVRVATQLGHKLEVIYVDRILSDLDDGDGETNLLRDLLTKDPHWKPETDPAAADFLTPVERLTPSLQVSAHAWSDDRVVELEFDATAWFEQASDEELRSLKKINWRGDYEADVVARYFQSTTTKRLFDYVYQEDPYGESDLGFEVAVDEEDAIRWLEEHRPHILNQYAIAPKRLYLYSDGGFPEIISPDDPDLEVDFTANLRSEWIYSVTDQDFIEAQVWQGDWQGQWHPATDDERQLLREALYSLRAFFADTFKTWQALAENFDMTVIEAATDDEARQLSDWSDFNPDIEATVEAVND